MIEVSAEQAGHYKTVTGTDTWAVASPAMSVAPEPCKFIYPSGEVCGDASCEGHEAAAPPAGMTAAEFAREWVIKGNEEFCEADEELSLRFAEAYAAHLRGEVARLREQGKEVEMYLREEWWENHGHTGLYGDDGEMQCSKCRFWDYKRDSLENLRTQVLAARLERARAALESTPQEEK